MSDYEFYSQLAFLAICIIGGWIWIRCSINKYVYNYDSYDYTKNID